MSRHDRQLIAKRLKDAGLKLTHQRLAIYEAVASATNHPSAEDIYGAVQHGFPMLSLNTVYTTLDTFKELGLIKEMRFLHNAARYDANTDPHHHAICLSCRKIEDFDDRALDQLRPPPAIQRSYRLVSHSVEFYGVCRTCQRQGH